jgi:hypothetical protein
MSLDPQLHRLITDVRAQVESTGHGVGAAEATRRKAWRTGRIALWLQVLDLVLVAALLAAVLLKG